MRGEAVPQQVRVHAPRVEAGVGRQASDDEERAGTRERPAARVEEELRTMAPVEVRPSAREVAPQRLDGLPADGHDPLLVSLAETAHEPLLEIDRISDEP